MDNTETPFDEKIFKEIRNSLFALNDISDHNQRENILIDQVLLMNDALKKIYKAISIASPAFMNTIAQVNAGQSSEDEFSRMIESHRGHLAAHDKHLAAHDDHLQTLSSRIDILNQRLNEHK